MRCIVNLIIAAHFMLCCGLASFAAGPQVRQETYQNEVCVKDSGVYEIGGDLYAHVKLSVARNDLQTRIKLKAVLAANELLKNWAINYTKGSRTNCMLPAGWKLAMGILDSYDPDWRFSDWNVKLVGQEFSLKRKGEYCFCQVVSKDELVQKIPKSFSASNPSKDMITHHLERVRTRLCKANVLDLFLDSKIRLVAKQEMDVVEKSLDDYYATSSFVTALKKRKAKIECPVMDIRWIEKIENQDDSSVSNVVVTTNIVDCTQATNHTNRAQTEGERKEMGVSHGGVVFVDVFVSEEQEIISRHIATTSVVRKVHRYKVVTRTAGRAVFEEIFLSNGCRRPEFSRQTIAGKRAVDVYFENTSSFNQKELSVRDALCENPGDALLWNIFGLCRMKCGDLMGALICFRNAREINFEDQSALTNLVVTYEKLNCRYLAYVHAIRGIAVSINSSCKMKCTEILDK